MVYSLGTLEFDRGASSFEGQTTDLDRTQLNTAELSAFSQKIGASTEDAALQARDLLDQQGRCTYAAALLFADRPQAVLPHAHVRVLHYHDDERGTGAEMTLHADRDVRFDGSLATQVRGAADLVEEFMPRLQRLGTSGKFEPTPLIPRDVWLEGLVNAVVHRSYSMAGDHIRFELFPRRIEITSPGRFPGLADPLRPLEIQRYARNPRIARVLAEVGLARELGEGIKRMFDTMRKHGLVDPVYTQSAGSVKLIIQSRRAIPDAVLDKLAPTAKKLITHMQLADELVGTGALAELAGVSRMSAARGLQQLQEVNLVKRVGKSPTDPRAVWRLL